MSSFHDRKVHRAYLHKMGRFISSMPQDFDPGEEGNWVERSVRLRSLSMFLSQHMETGEARNLVDNVLLRKRGYILAPTHFEAMLDAGKTIEFARCWKWLYHFNLMAMKDHCVLVRAGSRVMNIRETAENAGITIA